MNRKIIPFDYNGKQVRSTLINGEPWFVAKDVCKILEIGTEQIRRLDDDEKGLRSMHTPGGSQEMSIVSESGLYSLTLGSKKPEAKPFKRWVTHDVLPTLRKTGTYSISNYPFDGTYPNKSTSVAEYAKLLHEERMVMVAQHSSPQKIARQINYSLESWGLPVIEDFVEPEFPQQIMLTCTSYLTIGKGGKSNSQR